jgi:hypothetical protein
MGIIHKDIGGDFIQNIPEYVHGAGGFSKFKMQVDVNGGGSSSFEIPVSGSSAAKRIKIGDVMERWKNGRAMSVGKVVACDNRGDAWAVLMKSPLALWMEKPQIYSVGAAYASDIVSGLLTDGHCEASYRIDTTDETGISSTSYLVKAQSFLTPGHTVGSIINHYNQYENQHLTLAPSQTLTGQSKLWYYPRVTNKIHYVVDARTLAETPVVQPDWANFATKLLIFYGSGNPPSYQLNYATSAALAKYGYISKTVDLSGSETVAADANQIATIYFNSLMVDGLETPGATCELVLDAGTQLRGLNGYGRTIEWMVPGTNVLVTGISNPPRLLSVDSEAVFHIEEIAHDEESGTTRLRLNRGYDPAVMIARKKDSPGMANANFARALTADSSEINTLSGSGVVAADMTMLAGLTVSAAEVNVMAGQGVTASDMALLSGVIANQSGALIASGLQTPHVANLEATSLAHYFSDGGEFNAAQAALLGSWYEADRVVINYLLEKLELFGISATS